MLRTWLKKLIIGITNNKVVRSLSLVEPILSNPLTAPQIHVIYKKSTIGELVLSHRSENSILDDPGDLLPYVVGLRKRYATSSGVIWIDNNHLATVNLYGQHLRIYQLSLNGSESRENPVLKLLYEYTEGISYPENLSLSTDQRFLAVSNSLAGEKGFSIFEFDAHSMQIKNILGRFHTQSTCHGISFAPDSNFLAFTILESPGSIEIYEVKESIIRHHFTFANLRLNNRPKEASFTSDSKYVVLIYSYAASPHISNHSYGSSICIHRFSPQSGIIDKTPVAEYIQIGIKNSAFELANFRTEAKNGLYRLYVTDQEDSIWEFVFNPMDSSIKICGIYRNHVSFPHGISINPTGNLLAVCNLGDDSLKFFELDWPDLSIPDNRKHILLCGHTASSRLFGAERSLLDLARAFSSLNYKVSCLLPNDNELYSKTLADFADSIFVIPFSWPELPSHQDHRYIDEIVSLIHGESIDIVYSNSIAMPFALLAAKKAGVISVQHARELIVEDTQLANTLGLTRTAIIQQIEMNADFIICNSNATLKQFSPSENTVLLYNAADPEKFNIEPISDSGTLKVGIISGNNKTKGLDDFINLALLASHEVSLEFYCIGPKTAYINQLQKKYKLNKGTNNIRFIDYIADSTEAIGMVDIVLNLSNVGESFGRTIAEGMAARRPVIAYNHGAMSELIGHGESGYLVSPGDIKQVFIHLRWLDKNRRFAQEMGERGRKIVDDKFSMQRFIQNLSIVLKKIK